MNAWQVGKVRITKVLEGEYQCLPEQLLSEPSQEAIASIPWLAQEHLGTRGRLRFSVHALVVETPDRLIIVDTCIGNDRQGRDVPQWNQQQTAFLDDLTALGYDLRQFDTVLCTHLHADHVGWNTRLVEGRFEPTFPNARYLLSRAEFAYWQSRTDMAEANAMMADALAPVFEAGQVDLIDLPHVICHEVTLVKTPGHTPGHASVWIRSEGEEALISGDIVPHPCQLAFPGWGGRADVDPGLAESTRRDALAQCADRDALLIGTHFTSPTGGRVRRLGEAYRFDP